jgi:hypothetical protein
MLAVNQILSTSFPKPHHDVIGFSNENRTISIQLGSRRVCVNTTRVHKSLAVYELQRFR